MNKAITFILLFFSLGITNAQNLVLNGDFEQYSECPTDLFQFDSLLFWYNPCLPPYGGSGTQSGSPDYFNVCANGTNVGIPLNIMGDQLPNSGNGYMGFIPFSTGTSYREYFGGTLISPLIANACYQFEMHVNLAENSPVTIDTIGVYFSDTAITGLHSHYTLPYVPQLKVNSGLIVDTLNWVSINGSFTANGGEMFLLIGNFNSDSNTNWASVGTGGGNSYLYIDDVLITPCTNIEDIDNNEQIELFPNPVTEYLNISVKNNIPYELIIYDYKLNAVLQKQFLYNTEIDMSYFANGIYIIKLMTHDGVTKSNIILKH